MKIYLLDKGVVLVGKAWEVREKLKEYSRKYETVEQWTKDK
ncbi:MULTISPECIES: Z-ring formation inhibitor MciZ [Bacillaceae]|uniref:Z-ring formation inhibitor MciZ n=1 Tax=Metabacillus idriensis TaxID=324768 RepID=A0A6I2MBH1_9BACI|nr:MULTISPECIES: Z-ring formation inhibitor MciZ [Bacillaceae]OHR64327.1 cell division protein [Bacillus sp. HMSC76G11]QNG61343.1 Z-ring formation inhibitor MciZ [Bacillus sp. PAMC26568]USK32423.1 Z-ring formation inhibitor MciZ [Bacillus sp. F19]MCM3597050.1 Z-ring formation inhibitor MciZ [Metabacillus idriensis]MDR0138505.1 Z-ring formation inhibitor MciZ [Metabacillus idriensis]